MKPCLDTIHFELKAYLDGQLPFLLRLRVRRHLRRCAACREELAAMEQISNELRADVPQPLEAALRTRILNAVAQADAPSASLTGAKASRQRRTPLLLLGGVATALVAWITLYPLLHGDIQHAIMADTQAPQDTTGTSQLKTPASAAPAPTVTFRERASQNSVKLLKSTRSASAPTVMAGGLAAPPTLKSPKESLKGEMEERSLPLYQENKVAGHAIATVQPSVPKIMANITREPRKRARAGDTDDHGFAGGASIKGVYSSSTAAEKTPQVQSFFLSDTTTQPPVGGMSRAKQNIAGGFNGASNGQNFLNVVAGEDRAGRQMRRAATLAVQVDNVDVKSETATQYVQMAGGLIASNEMSTGEDNLKMASLTLKVPVAQFDMVLGQVVRLGEVKAKNVTGEDLTEQISDQQQTAQVLSQEINTTQAELTHRMTKAGRQERLDTLRELRTRIAQTKARLQLLQKLGALSTITLELTEKPHSAPIPAPKTGGIVGDMNDTLHAAVRSMTDAARLPILTFIWILAYSPFWLLLLLGYRYATRR